MTLNMRIYVCHEPIAGRYSQYCWAAIDLRPRLRDSLLSSKAYRIFPNAVVRQQISVVLLFLPAAAVIFSL